MGFKTLPSLDIIQKTIESVQARGVNVIFVNDRGAALEKVKELIPPGAPVMTGASVTLKEIGLEEMLKNGQHPWQNLKAAILAEKDPENQRALRKQATLADYYLGSVNAISQTGELVIASMTGSQLPAYSFSSKNIIWITGVQKITTSLEEALRRVREYVLPLEDKHMKELGAPGSKIGKILIFESESPFLNRQITMILVNEELGF